MDIVFVRGSASNPSWLWRHLRRHAARSTGVIGNFRADVTRITVWLLVPLSLGAHLHGPSASKAGGRPHAAQTPADGNGRGLPAGHGLSRLMI